MAGHHVFVSKYEELSLKEVVEEVKKRNPQLNQEEIAESIGYQRTALYKKGQSGELTIKILLIYRYLLVAETKTSPNSKEKEDVKNVYINNEDVISLLKDIKGEQLKMSANCQTILHLVEKGQEKLLDEPHIPDVATQAKKIQEQINAGTFAHRNPKGGRKASGD